MENKCVVASVCDKSDLYRFERVASQGPSDDYNVYVWRKGSICSHPDGEYLGHIDSSGGSIDGEGPKDIPKEVMAEFLEEVCVVESSIAWSCYLDYLKNWIKDREDDMFQGMSPVCYDEFLDNEFQELY